MKIGLISLGCAKNLVDSEIMLGALRREGFELTSRLEEADAVLINTCSFIETAKEESIRAILETHQWRQSRPEQALIVAGCLPQRYARDLQQDLPEADALVGLDQVTEIPAIVRAAVAARRAAIPARLDSTETIAFVSPKPVYIPDYATPRYRLTPPHFAYVKVAEGCNHPCTFCIIPQIRGRHRSRPPQDVVAEVRELVRNGCREINLISQDTTFYGVDLQDRPRMAVPAARAGAGGEPSLCSLLRELNRIEGDFWVRLLYTHPAHWSDELIETIAACPKVCRYVDMPLQHIHDEMLAAMQRQTSREHIESLIRRIRAGIPGVALRTTFIVGFPGETEAHFQALLDFIREMKFERLGVFAYSREEGTRAFHLKGQVPVRVKKERHHRAMAAQQQVALALNQKLVGQAVRVLVEGTAASVPPRVRERGRAGRAGPSSQVHLFGRSAADAPDIDGRVYWMANGGSVRAGQFVNVRVTDASAYDLYGEPASATSVPPLAE